MTLTIQFTLYEVTKGPRKGGKTSNVCEQFGLLLDFDGGGGH